MVQLLPDGAGRTIVLGPDVLAGQQVQVVVPCGVWQGSLLEPGGAFALLGCTVAPGFDYADYESGVREALVAQYPAFAEWIERSDAPACRLAASWPTQLASAFRLPTQAASATSR